MRARRYQIELLVLEGLYEDAFDMAIKCGDLAAAEWVINRACHQTQ